MNYNDNPFLRVGEAFRHAMGVDVQDVDYEEVKTEANEDDKMSDLQRDKKIIDAAEKLFPVSDKNAMCSLMNVLLFSQGAKWADENPISDYPTTTDWKNAQKCETDAMLERANGPEHIDPVLAAISFLAFNRGAEWAHENPREK